MLFAAVLLAAGLAPPPVQDPLEASGFRHFYNLEFDEAIADFATEAARHPNDPQAHNHLALALLYRDMFRSGALETELVSGGNPFASRGKVKSSPEDQRRFEKAILTSVELSRKRLRRDERDIEALYALGVAYGVRANYKFLVKKAWRDALRDATTARKQHNRVTELDPSRIDARLLQGAHEYVVGSLPLAWRLLGFLIGFRGDKDEGIRTLELVAEKGRSNRFDAQVLLCAIYRRESEPKKAVPLLAGMIRRFPRNYLLRLEIAQMYSDIGEKANALAALDDLERLKRSGAPGCARLRIERIDYARGTIYFWYNDLDKARAFLKSAAGAAEDLDRHSGVGSWTRLGQVYDLAGERTLAIDAYRKAIEFAGDVDPAAEARKYLKTPFRGVRKS